MSRFDVEYAVVGGGCAGLSLAVELAERGLAARGLVVLEPREGYRRDRTWGHWDVSSHRFADLVSHRWSQWSVRCGGREERHASTRYRYCELDSGRFYARAHERLSEEAGVGVKLGTRVEALREDAGGVRVESSAGELRARYVFDARAGLPAARPPELLQHFVGLRIRSDSPAFDPETVTLMDFDVPQADGIHFFYVLPADPHTALVEATFLSPRTLEPHRYREAIDAYLDRRFGLSKFEVLEAERGVIPMSSARPEPQPGSRVLRIGTRGGLVRPSTGYAFLAIQRHVRAVAEGLARGRLVGRPPRDRLLRAMDAIFLHHLRDHPAEAPALFARLFANVSPDRLVRFLADVPGARDRAAVVAAMPKRRFLATAWRARAAWAAA